MRRASTGPLAAASAGHTCLRVPCVCCACADHGLWRAVADDMFTAAQDLVFEGHSDKAAALARCCAELKPRDAQVRSFLSSLFLGSNSFADGERWCAPLGR